MLKYTVLIVAVAATIAAFVPAGYAAEIEEGLYRAVFTNRSGGQSTNNCGLLTVSYADGHNYRYGKCNSAMDGIAQDAKVEETTDISVTEKRITIISATYDIIEAKKDQMIGEWKLNDFHNPFLVFKRVD